MTGSAPTAPSFRSCRSFCHRTGWRCWNSVPARPQPVTALAEQAGLASATQDDLAGVTRALVLRNADAMKKPFGTTKWAV